MGYLTKSFLEQLNRQSRELENIYYTLATKHGLPESAFWVLYILSDGTRRYSQQAICKEWSFSKQTIHSTIQWLIQKGYVYLERVERSRGEKAICLTKEGEYFVESHILPIRQIEETALAKMPKEEQELYVELAVKFTACLRERAENYLQSEHSVLDR